MLKTKVNRLMVQSIDIFQDVDATQCDAISALMEVLNFNKSESIFSRNDNKRSVFFVAVGEVRVTSFAANGREASYNEKCAGQMFGELAAIDGIPRATDVIAISNVTLLSMNHLDFNRLLDSYPQVSKRVMNLFVQEIRSLTRRVYEYSAYDVRRRIHNRIYDIAIDAAGDSDSIMLDNFPRHSDIASRVATTREAVTREMSRLISLDLLKKVDNIICIPSLKKFKELLHDIDD